jgi:hypothetical protein
MAQSNTRVCNQNRPRRDNLRDLTRKNMKRSKLVRPLFAVISATVMAWSAHASLIWYGDPSVGLSVFKEINIQDDNDNNVGNPSPNGSSASVASDPTYGQVFQFYKAVNDRRCEAHGAAGFNAATGNTYYIGWRFKLNNTVDDNAVFQWKSYGSPMYQDYPFVLKMVGGALQLHYFGSNITDHVVWSGNISAGTWYSAVIEVNVSSSWTGGRISFWLNDVQEVNGYAGRTFDGSSVDPKWGIYGANSSQVTDDVEALKIGTTFADVDPGGGNFTGTFEIQNEASGLVLNNQGSLTNGSAITQWTETSSPNLEWTFIATSGGYYQINSVKSGKDAVVQGASTASGAKIVQWSFGSSGDDQWLPEQNSDGSYTFANLHSGLVLGDPGSSTSTSTQMDQETANGGSNQKWNLLPQ